MLRAFFACVVALLLCAPRVARADDGAPKKSGIAVLATDGATDATWPLARAIYASTYLRPENVDDAHARILAGEKRATEQPSIVELEELRAGVKGDDAASRQVLSALSDKLGVASVLVVFAGTPPTARLFDASTHTFDAATYSPDQNSSPPSWDGTIRSLERPFLPPPPLVTQTATTTPDANARPAPPKHDEKSKAFYESPWFWAAIGAVLLIGGGVLIATNVQTGDTIHLQLKLP
jgi:hypothetical protein